MVLYINIINMNTIYKTYEVLAGWGIIASSDYWHLSLLISVKLCGCDLQSDFICC